MSGQNRRSKTTYRNVGAGRQLEVRKSQELTGDAEIRQNGARMNHRTKTTNLAATTHGNKTQSTRGATKNPTWLGRRTLLTWISGKIFHDLECLFRAWKGFVTCDCGCCSVQGWQKIGSVRDISTFELHAQSEPRRKGAAAQPRAGTRRLREPHNSIVELFVRGETTYVLSDGFA